MLQLQKIDIDWDIHKLIETERRSFEEQPYVALRRLMGLPATPEPKVTEKVISNGASWFEDGVEVPHGSLARMEYLRGSQVYEGMFRDGRLVVDGRSFEALSAASNALAVTKKGERTSLNGWRYWLVKFPGETTWRGLWDLREMKRARK